MTQELQQIQTELSTNVNDLVEMSNLCKVVCPDTANQAVELTNTIKKTAKNIEERRDALVRPANEYVKSINATFKQISAPLDEARKKVDGQIISFQKEQAKIEAEKRRKEQEEAAEKLRQEAEKMKEDGKDKAANMAEKAAEIMQKEEIKVEVKSLKSDILPTFKIRKIKKFKVTDIKALAEARIDLVLPNESLIGQLVRGGMAAIAGVEIWEEEIAG